MTRFALNHTDALGRTVRADSNLSRLLDLAQHGDTLHKLGNFTPATASDLLAAVDQQLDYDQFTRI